MLVQDPVDFDRTTLVVERVVGDYGEPARYPAPLGSIPMDLGAMQGPSSRPGAHPGSEGNGDCSNDKCTCHYCKQHGYFMLFCLKLKKDIEAKAAGWFPPR